MVSTISEGEGTFGAVYTATAYSLVPYILIGPFVIIATYMFTLNEAIIIQLLWYVAIGSFNSSSFLIEPYANSLLLQFSNAL